VRRWGQYAAEWSVGGRIALADRLGIPVTYLSGDHGGWGSDRQEFADKLLEVLQDARS
jgi:hypothetical protein